MILLMYQMLPGSIQRRAALRSVHVDEEKLRDVRIHLAESQEDVRAALRLVRGAYSSMGKIAPGVAELHVTKHNALPSTLIIVAKRGDRVVGTTSLVRDSPLGLPLDFMPGSKLDEMRTRGLSLCESTDPVCTEEFRGSGLVLYLVRAMVHAALRADVDRLVTAAPPRSALIFEQLLAGERLGEPAVHPMVHDQKPLAAVQLDLRTCEGRIYERFYELAPYERTPHFLFFTKKTPQIELPDELSISATRRAASAALIRARLDLFLGLPHAEQRYVRHAVPEVGWPTPAPASFVGDHQRLALLRQSRGRQGGRLDRSPPALLEEAL